MYTIYSFKASNLFYLPNFRALQKTKFKSTLTNNNNLGLSKMLNNTSLEDNLGVKIYINIYIYVYIKYYFAPFIVRYQLV